MLYFTRGAEGSLMSSSRSVSFTLGEPIIGFLFILAVPWGISFWLWYVVIVAISFVLLQGSSTIDMNYMLTGPGAEGFRFAFPVLGALLLSIVLMFQLVCPKSLLSARRERNRAATAQANLQNVIGEDLSIVRVSALCV